MTSENIRHPMPATAMCNAACRSLFFGFAVFLLMANPAEASGDRFIADTDSAYAACLRRCSRSDQLGNLTRNGCLVGCAQARQNFTLEGCRYRNEDRCNRALMEVEMGLDDILAEQYDWCNKQWPHPHRRKGCKDAIEEFYQTAIKQVCRPAAGHRPPHPKTEIEGTTVVPTGATFARSAPPSAAPVFPLEQPRSPAPAVSRQPASVPLAAPVPAGTSGMIRDTPKYDRRFYRTRPAAPATIVTTTPATKPAPVTQAKALSLTKGTGGKAVPVVTPSTAMAPKSSVKSAPVTAEKTVVIAGKYTTTPAEDKVAPVADTAAQETAQTQNSPAQANPPAPVVMTGSSAPAEPAAAPAVVPVAPPVYPVTPPAGYQGYYPADAPPVYRVLPAPQATPIPQASVGQTSYTPQVYTVTGTGSGAPVYSATVSLPVAPSGAGVYGAQGAGGALGGTAYDTVAYEAPAPVGAPAGVSSSSGLSLLPGTTGANLPETVPFRGDITEMPIPLPQPIIGQ